MIARAVLLLLLAAPPALADPPRLGLPIDCRLGETCWLMNYADTDPGPDAKDFQCRPRSYQGHDGTDFAIRDKAVMARGVAVLAAAAGEVAGVRDGQPDGAFLAGGRPAVQDKECGNGVTVRHDDGWTTQYCHLRQGSIAVKSGQKVAQGDRLGLVGLSGMSEYPHVHLTLRKGSAAVDPFTGADVSAGCGRPGPGLWDLPYQAMSLYAVGFADKVPDKAALLADAGTPVTLAKTSPLVVWATAFGVVPGDKVVVTIHGPDGATVFSHSTTIDRTQAWRLAAAGRKPPGGSWTPGRYAGEVTLERDGRALETRAVTVELR